MLPKNSHEVLKLTDYEFGITPISIQFPEQCLGTILI